MLRLSYWVCMLASLFLLSCNGNNEKEKEIESLNVEVIGIHDEIMPKMDKIMQLRAQLEQEIENVNDSTSTDSVAITRNLIINLEEADAAMMVWMRNYDPMMKDMSHEEKLLYLEGKKKDIQQVKEQMLSAISESEEYLENN